MEYSPSQLQQLLSVCDASLLGLRAVSSESFGCKINFTVFQQTALKLYAHPLKQKWESHVHVSMVNHSYTLNIFVSASQAKMLQSAVR